MQVKKMERHLGAQVKQPQNDNTKFSISCVWNTWARLALPWIPAELFKAHFFRIGIWIAALLQRNISSKLLRQIASEAKQTDSATQGGVNYKLTMHRTGWRMSCVPETLQKVQVFDLCTPFSGKPKSESASSKSTSRSSSASHSSRMRLIHFWNSSSLPAASSYSFFLEGRGGNNAQQISCVSKERCHVNVDST